MRGGGSAVRFHDCTNNKVMTEMRDLKDMVSVVILSCKKAMKCLIKKGETMFILEF